jgi:hypothetical protein
MRCPNCKIEILTQSRFCPNCGTVFGGKLPTERNLFSDKPPKYIDDVNLTLIGHSEKKDILGRAKRGFTLTFSLKDENNNQTRSDGTVELVFSNQVGTTLIGTTFAGQPHFSFNVNKNDFCSFTTIFRHKPGKIERLGYFYRHNTLEIPDIPLWFVEIWFRTPDNRKLYAKST